MQRFPPRRILAAVDLSETSLRAWRTARQVAERFGAVLEAVYCDEPPPSDLAVYGSPALDAAMRLRVLAQLRRRIGPRARLHAVRGEPVRVLLQLARERGYDLVVMGTHRRAGAARVLLGSVAEAVVRDCPCPVLVVPAAARAVRRVLAPVNEAAYARKSLLAAGLVARAYRARLTVLHVVTDPIFGPNPKKLLRARIAELPEAVRLDTRPLAEIREFDPVRDILRASRGHDLLVLAAHRKSLLGDWVLGTTAQRVIRHSRIPVLTIPTSSRR